MAKSNTAFALEGLARWSRDHGIYEVRDVLAKGLYLAEGAESSELLAQALEEAALAADALICPDPPARPKPEVDRPRETEEVEAAKPEAPAADAQAPEAAAKPRRRARVAGKFRGDDPATPENEAWITGDEA